MVAPAEDTALAQTVVHLLAEWREPPEGRSKDAVVADLVALGVPGFERVLALLDPMDAFIADGGLKTLIDGLGAPSLEVTAPAIASDGRMRIIGLRALGQSRDLYWQFDEHGPAVTRALLAALDDASADVRCSALYFIGQTRSTGVAVAERIAAHLLATEADERSAARDALQTLGPAAVAAIPTLLEAVRRLEGEERYEVAGLLAWMPGGSRADVEATLKLLGDEDAELRKTIAQSVCTWYHAYDLIAPRLLALLHDPSERVQFVAGAGLECLARDASAAMLLRNRIPDLPPADAAQLIAFAYRGDLPALMAVASKLLSASDAALRAATLRALNDVKADVVDHTLLARFLDDTASAVRVEAALLLSRTDRSRRERAVDIASSAAADPDVEVRLTSARIFASAADPEKPTHALLALLADADERVRREACRALTASTSPLGAAPPGVIDALITGVLSRDGIDAARVVLRFEGGADTLVRTAVAALESNNAETNRPALAVLAEAGPAARSAAPVVSSLTGDGGGIEDAALWTDFAITGSVSPLGYYVLDVERARRLVASGDSGADAVLQWTARASWYEFKEVRSALAEDETLARAVLRGAAVVGDTEESVAYRRGALRLATTLGPRRAVELAAGLASDPASTVRDAVTATLEELGDGGSDLAPAAGALRALLRDEDARVRREAILAARRLSELRPELRERLTDPDAAVRLQAAAALIADADDPAAPTVLFAALRDTWRATAADCRLVEAAFAKIPPTAKEAGLLDQCLRGVEDCAWQRVILRRLALLGPDAAPSLTAVRAALANELPCHWGVHPEEAVRGEAIAALAAMGPAARAAIPDLAAVAARDRKFAEHARAAMAAISAPSPTGR